MKKLLAIAPAIALLSACASAPIAQPSPAQVQATLESAKTYKCDNSAEVIAVYGTDVVNVKITAPTLNLNQSAMVLNQAVAASGTRYITQSPDKSTSYEWHSKANEGVLSVMHNGTPYTFSCQMM